MANTIYLINSKDTEDIKSKLLNMQTGLSFISSELVRKDVCMCLCMHALF